MPDNSLRRFDESFVIQPADQTAYTLSSIIRRPMELSSRALQEIQQEIQREEDIAIFAAISAASTSYANSDMQDFRTRKEKEDAEIELLKKNRIFLNCIMEIEIGELE